MGSLSRWWCALLFAAVWWCARAAAAVLRAVCCALLRGGEEGGGGRDRRGRREKSQPLSFLVDFSRSGPRDLARTPSSILGIAAAARELLILFIYFIYKQTRDCCWLTVPYLSLSRFGKELGGWPGSSY